MIKKILLLIMIATIPGIVFLTVRQVEKYNQVDKQVKSIIVNQRELFEQNKRMVANISILSSPGRIDSLAENELLLQKSPSEIIRIEFKDEKENGSD